MRRFLPFAVLLLCVSLQRSFADTDSERAWALIRTGLGDSDSDRRAKAVQVLGLLPGEAYAQQLAVNSLRDPEPRVRAAACAALGQMKAYSALPDLRAKLDDPESMVVFAAGDALVELKDPAGYGLQFEILTRTRKGGLSLRDHERDLLNHPKELEMLGIQEGIGFIPYGGMSYTAFKLLTKDAVTPARAKAARDLAKDPDPRSGEALAKTLYDAKWLVRAACAAALAERGETKWLYVVVDEMKDENDVVKYTCAAAVIRLSNPHPAEANPPMSR